MTTALILVTESAEDLVRDFLAARSPATLRGYSQSLADFARWLGVPTPADAARRLLEGGPGPANATVGRYRASMLDRGLAPATINLRLSALRAMLGLARRVGMVTWTLDVDGVRAQTYRDTRGPGLDAVRAILAATSPVDPLPRDVRDHAMIRLMFDLGLRRGEVQSLDLEHVDLAAGRLLVLGKGTRERTAVDLAPATAAALRAWISARGAAAGPLFTRDGSDDRIALGGINVVLARVGAAAGVAGLHPHGLRHTAITTALDATGGDVRSVQRFSRHRDVRVLQRYDDARDDGAVAALVAGAVG